MEDDLPYISLVIPVYNEAGAIEGVVDEAVDVLTALSKPYEVILIDDGSTDATPEVLAKLRARHAAVRVFTLNPNSGQSAAFGVGFDRSRGQIVVLMDGDGQNDPHDIPRLLDAVDKGCDACCGYRVERRDTWSKRIAGRIANAIRRRILADGVIDTGCSLKAIRRDCVGDLPMALRGMHRFLPALLKMRGATIEQVPVNHRARLAGTSKYTNLGRLAATVWDLWAVRWMQKRYRRFAVRHVS